MGYPQLYRAYFGRGVRERGQAGSAATDIMAAGLAADASIWTLRYPETAVMPGAGPYAGKRLYVQRILVQFNTLTGFVTAITAGRRIHLVRGAPTAGTAANPTGGAAFTMVRKRSDTSDENLGVGRIATTAALTTTGLTFETPKIRRLNLSQAGIGGAAVSVEWRFDGVVADPIYLLPGELLAIQANATFDATGTFEMAVDCDAVELAGV